MKKVLLSLVIFSLFSTSTCALASNVSGATDFSIILSNNTGSTCNLSTQVDHGYLMKPFPPSIPARGRNVARMSQSMIYGPDLTVTVNCGDNRHAVLRAQQDFTWSDRTYSYYQGQILVNVGLNIEMVKYDGEKLTRPPFSTGNAVFWNIR